MNIGIIAHNSKKSLIEDFCIAYKGILMKHEVYATGTTGRRIEEVTNLHVHKFLPGSVGGDKQFTEMIERGDMDMVIFFYNPTIRKSRMSTKLSVPATSTISRLQQISELRSL